MLKLAKSSDDEIIICPRWPLRHVFITEESYRQLKQAQRNLSPHHIQLALTRGYENESAILKRVRQFMRWAGGALFCMVFPDRSDERNAIFCPNGHDRSGDCIDVSVFRDQKILSFLPQGVFTRKKTISAIRSSHDRTLAAVWGALEAAGFS